MSQTSLTIGRGLGLVLVFVDHYSRCSRTLLVHYGKQVFSCGGIYDALGAGSCWIFFCRRLLCGFGSGRGNCCSLLAYLPLTGYETYPAIGCWTELGLLNGDEILAAMED